MDQHISFGDLVTFVWADAVTPEMKQLALRVNAHLVGCQECQNKVDRLEALRQEAEELRRQNALRQEATLRLDQQKDRVIPFLRQEMKTLEFSAADSQDPQIAEEGEIYYPEEED